MVRGILQDLFNHRMKNGRQRSKETHKEASEEGVAR